MASKIASSPAAALADLKAQGLLRDGMTVMVGGFGLCGIPEHLIVALRDSGVDVTAVPLADTPAMFEALRTDRVRCKVMIDPWA